MKLVKNIGVIEDKWIKLLNKSKFSSPFQTPQFYKLYYSSKGFNSDVFAIEDSDEYKSLLVVTIQKGKGLKSFFSIRGIIYGGPLLLTDESIYLEKLLKEVHSFYKRKLIYLEIRNHFDYSPFINTFNRFGLKFEEHLNVVINFNDKDINSVMSNMNYNRRRQIQLSFKQGAEVRLVENEEEVITLYDILRDLYLKRVKLPLYPLSYFLDLYRSDKIGKVFVVIHNDKVIGGAFCIYHDKMTINTFYYAGLRNYHKKIYATHLAVLGAINFALENNLKMLDFMGAGKPNVDYGVRKYKLEFGGNLVEYGRFVKVYNKFLFKIGKIGLAIIKKIT